MKQQNTMKSRAIVALSAFCFTVMVDYASAGGWVNGSQTLNPATAVSTGSTVNVTPTFNNAQFTDKILVSGINNNPIKTPSTSDPVSTITGNNYHDELDFQIRGRNGLNYVFSRTNNSGKSAATKDVGLGYGWVHSYAMNLLSNDFGACPNCPTGTGAGQSPENGDGKTSSITYTDERGGQTNFLETSTTTNGVTTYSVTNPLSNFDTLTLSTPSNGIQWVTLAFRNGTQYLFNVSGGDIGVTPNLTARLATIKNQWGDQLNINYDTSGRIATITDNLGISTRTGLTFNYANGDKHITSIRDWSGRTRYYNYIIGYLSTYTDPLGNVLHYYYTGEKFYNNFQVGTGNYLLNAIIKPVTRNGLYVYTLFNYYQNGRVINYSDGMGNTEIMDYDLFRSRTRVTDPRSNVREYDYDSNGFMTKMLEPDGGIMHFASQTDGLRASKSDALGYKTQYSYCLNNSLTTCPNSAANNNTGGSDTGGNVTLEQDKLGYTIKTTYGPYDQVTSITDKNGNTVNTSFYTTTGQQANQCDLAGKPNTVTIAALTAGGTTTNNVALQTYCWNSNGTLNNTKEFLDTAGLHIRTTRYTYDSSGLNVTDVNITATNTTALIHSQFTYDNLGRVQTSTLNRTTSITNSALEALTTRYTYDALDRTVQVKNPEGRVQQTVYDGNGKIYQQIAWYPIDPNHPSATRDRCNAPANGYIVCTEATYQYDTADRPISVTDIYGNTTSIVYDQSGNVISQTDANGHTSQYQYDAMNRVTAVIDANGRTSKAVYNQRGDLTSATNPNNETVTNQYDELGRLSKVTDNLGNITTFKYDKNGNKLCAVDGNSASGAAGHQPLNSQQCTVSFTYDQLNRLTQTTDAQNHITTYAYNLLGQTISVTDANQYTTAFAYDDLGRMTVMTDPLNNTHSVVTDEAGNKIQITDRNGQVSQHMYDSLNRKLQSNYADGTYNSYTYNNFDDLVQVQNEVMAYTYNYDSKHRPLSKTDSRLGLSESWNYDAADNIQSKTDYQNNVTTYQYDDSNRLVAESNPAYLQVSYHYDPAGRLLDRILSNNAKTSYQYDAGGRLSNLKNITASGTVVNNTSYTRDALGNILTAQEATGTSQPSGTSSFSYDPLYRLLKANYPNSANNETLTYDAVGNRLTYQKGSFKLYYYDYQPNRIGNVSPTENGTVYEAYNYDANGNMVAIFGILPFQSLQSNRSFSINWDAQNRISSINNTSLNTNINVSYQYDPFGNRIRKTPDLPSNSLNYYLQGDRLEAIYDVSGNIQAQYMRGSVIDEVVNGYQRDSSNQLINYTYHHDALESVLGQSGNTGSIMASQGYTAFGSTINAAGASNNTLKFTGRELDGESGFYYYRARYYEPVTGAFMSEDPLGYRAGINFYTYCGNNPVNCRDPFGLYDLTIQAGFHLPVSPGVAVGPLWSWTANDYSNNPSLNFTENPVVPETVFGSLGDFGTSFGVTNISGISNNGGYQLNLASGKYGGIQITFVDQQNTNLSYLNPARYIDGFSVGLGLGAATPINVSRASDPSKIKIGSSGSSQNQTASPGASNKSANSGYNVNADVASQSAAAALNAATNSAMDAVNSAIAPPTPPAPTSTLSVDVIGFGNDAADGGFILYPNMSNTSQIQSVYSKH